MERARPPHEWSQDARAAAVLDVVYECIQAISNPRWRSATQAAFRIPAENYMDERGDSLTQRWRRLAELHDSSGSPQALTKAVEAYRGYWIACAPRLAEELDQRFWRLSQDRSGWERYRRKEPQSPPRSLPISFERTDVLYHFDGVRGVQATSYRWLTAHNPVDHYEAVGWYYNEPDAPIEILPLANCELDGELRDLPAGGRSARLKFSHQLEPGEQYFFAYTTVFHSTQPCRPSILYEVRGLRMDELVIRAQFDVAALPAKCWYFDVEAQTEGWRIPANEDPEVLAVASNGYVEHEFRHCRRGRKYGLRWQWT